MRENQPSRDELVAGGLHRRGGRGEGAGGCEEEEDEEDIEQSVGAGKGDVMNLQSLAFPHQISVFLQLDSLNEEDTMDRLSGG